MLPRVDARPETIDWLERYYALLDSGQVREAVTEFLDPACTFRIANEDPVGFIDAARALAPLVRGTRHRVLSALEDGDGTIACELEITYTRHDGSAVTLPGSLFAHVRDGRFLAQRAYIDQAPLRAKERTD
jgi:ketosteroid isomerase-like protein